MFEGAGTLFRKEVLRFWNVAAQTVAAPVLTSVMYMLIFGHVLSTRVEALPGVGYTSFLLPGLVMMSVLQNAFANTSSSLVQSKISGNIVFLLVTPLSHWAWFAAYVGAAVVRGLAVGVGVLVVTVWFAPLQLAQPLWIVVFAALGAGMLGALGLIAGLWADKFDQMAAFQNFIIMPMTFLSGVFYSVHSLPPVWQAVSHLNPFFYMIDGFRRGFFGLGDVSPLLSLAVVGGSFVAVSAIALRMLATGYSCARDKPQRAWVTIQGMADPTPQNVRDYIAAGLPCEHIEIEGDGRHFFATIVSSAFEGLPRVRRHQQVYAALGDRMREQIHALSMKTLTPAEHAAAAPAAAAAPSHHH